MLRVVTGRKGTGRKEVTLFFTLLSSIGLLSSIESFLTHGMAAVVFVGRTWKAYQEFYLELRIKMPFSLREDPLFSRQN
jgi:hypothetical protein